MALVRALCLRAKKKVTIYTEYGFSVMHAHGAMWKERHLLTSGREEIKHTYIARATKRLILIQLKEIFWLIRLQNGQPEPQTQVLRP